MRTLFANATIVDGTGAPPFTGSVLLEGARIRDVLRGEAPPVADARVVDARGECLTPGFIDIHRHGDLAALKPGFGHMELAQGITSCVFGNCGMSPAPCAPENREALYALIEPCLGSRPDLDFPSFDDYLRELRALPLPVGVTSLLGVGSLRIALRGMSDAPLTDAEISRMREAVAQALRAGAPGVSVGLMYAPECYGSAREYVALLGDVGALGGVVTAHIRGEGDALAHSVEEILSIARDAQTPLHISHFKSVGVHNWRREIYRAIERIDEARARGQDVTVDFYPYDAGATSLASMLPPSFVAGDLVGALRRLGEPGGAQALREAFARPTHGWDDLSRSLGWDRIVITSVRGEGHRALIGYSIADAARYYECYDACEFVAYLLHAENGRVGIINRSMCRDDIDAVARLPYSMLISDSLYEDGGSMHPRAWGSFPKLLREYVRERGILTLEQAIHKMTGMPARRMGFANKGRIAPGCDADLLLFDPQAFTDDARFECPARPSRGLTLAMVGGEARAPFAQANTRF